MDEFLKNMRTRPKEKTLCDPVPLYRAHWSEGLNGALGSGRGGGTASLMRRVGSVMKEVSPTFEGGKGKGRGCGTSKANLGAEHMAT